MNHTKPAQIAAVLSFTGPLIPNNLLPGDLEQEDRFLFQHFKTLTEVKACHGGALKRSGLDQERKLYDCIDIALTVADDYLMGKDIAAQDVASFMGDIEDMRKHIEQTVDQPASFPWFFCLTAYDLAGEIEARLKHGEYASDDLKKELNIKTPQRAAPSAELSVAPAKVATTLKKPVPGA